ncbi:hypothetical protein P171DRAFT_485306 [Karstenula rhodostoma CBS 690.94]|uniref:Uncharacterized protein n=1 Tax=Karstenula rhodostoma CBS 690.94 TaxID=1392251 RepID=A0A9P4PJL3_9PLEO|nr:hypothetical protein P171DRAFT_485306 [Karstenula rhodostoma CBS 690.94]
MSKGRTRKRRSEAISTAAANAASATTRMAKISAVNDQIKNMRCLISSFKSDINKCSRQLQGNEHRSENATSRGEMDMWRKLARRKAGEIQDLESHINRETKGICELKREVEEAVKEEEDDIDAVAIKEEPSDSDDTESEDETDMEARTLYKSRGSDDDEIGNNTTILAAAFAEEDEASDGDFVPETKGMQHGDNEDSDVDIKTEEMSDEHGSEGGGTVYIKSEPEWEEYRAVRKVATLSGNMFYQH